MITINKMYTVLARTVFAFMLCILMTPVISTANAEGITSLEEAINQAGRQRMLTQRMLKNYVLSGMDVRGRKSEEQLEAAITLYDNQLSALKKFAQDEATQAKLTAVAELWLPLKKQYQGKPNKEAVLALRQQNEQLLKASHQVVLALEDQATTKAGVLVNLAGRQRMLTQRMASSYALMAWGFDEVAEVKEAYEQAYREFESALQTLSASSINTAEISQALSDVERQFGRFAMTASAGKTVFVPGLIERSAERMLVRMNEVTAMYARLGQP